MPMIGNRQVSRPVVVAIVAALFFVATMLVVVLTSHGSKSRPGQPAQAGQGYSPQYSQNGQSKLPPSQVAALEAATPPSPGYPSGFAPVEGSGGQPAQYASNFVQRLLSIDFARESRNDLARWAVAESAPAELPGLPQNAANNSLYLALFFPDRAGGTPSSSPVPSAADWSTYTADKITWTPSGLYSFEDPEWQAKSSGANLSDPLMTLYDVTATITDSEPGHSPVAKQVKVKVGLGTGQFHPGYGAFTASWEASQ